MTVNAGSGGSVSPSGTNSYQVENAINITATPNTGYKFSGWIVTEEMQLSQIQEIQVPLQPCIVLTVLLQQTLA